MPRALLHPSLSCMPSYPLATTSTCSRASKAVSLPTLSLENFQSLQMVGLSSGHFLCQTADVVASTDFESPASLGSPWGQMPRAVYLSPQGHHCISGPSASPKPWLLKVTLVGPYRGK